MMRQVCGDFGRGLLYAAPVLVVAALGVREVLQLRAENHELEAGRLAAERALARVYRRHDENLGASRRSAAAVAAAQGEAEDRLSRVVDFLKGEVATAESTIEALRAGSPAAPAGGAAAAEGAAAEGAAAEGRAALLREIARLNEELEALRLKGEVGRAP